jgi:hypothetical protein
LTARKNLQQQHQEQQLQPQQHQLQQQPTANGVEQAVLVLPAPGTPTAGSAGQGQQAPAGVEEGGVQDGQASAEGSKKAGVRCVDMPRGLCGLQVWCGVCHPASCCSSRPAPCTSQAQLCCKRWFRPSHQDMQPLLAAPTAATTSRHYP